MIHLKHEKSFGPVCTRFNWMDPQFKTITKDSSEVTCPKCHELTLEKSIKLSLSNFGTGLIDEYISIYDGQSNAIINSDTHSFYGREFRSPRFIIPPAIDLTIDMEALSRHDRDTEDRPILDNHVAFSHFSCRSTPPVAELGPAPSAGLEIAGRMLDNLREATEVQFMNNVVGNPMPQTSLDARTLGDMLDEHENEYGWQDANDSDWGYPGEGDF